MEKLVFSPEQSAHLGLNEGEAVRVLASGSRTVLLERILRGTASGEITPAESRKLAARITKGGL